MLICILFFVLVCQQANSQTIEPIIFDRTGNPVSGSSAQISEDGRFIAFTSTSNNIVEEDTNYRNRGFYEQGPAADVFLFDRNTNVYKRLSLTMDGVQIEGGESLLLSVNKNFDQFLYTSIGNSKFPGDTFDPLSHIEFDIFLFNSSILQTSWLSTAPDGSEGDFDTRKAVLSSDGRYAIIFSKSSNLLPDTAPYNSIEQIIWLDIETNERELVTQSIDGATPSHFFQFEMDLNNNGRYVVFISSANNLTSDGVGGIFLRDMETKTTELISRTPTGEPVEFEFLFEAESIDISDDGRYTFFISSSNQHVENDPHPTERIGRDGYIYDRVTNQTKVVPLGEFDSADYLRGASIGSMSPNGQYIIFARRVNSGNNDFPELYLYDQFADQVELLLSKETNHPLIPSPNISGIPRVTSNGKNILFSSNGILYLMTRDVTTSHIEDWELMN